MKIQAKFTPQTLDEVATLNRRWHYWPVFLFRNLYGTVLYLALLYLAAITVVKNLRSPLHLIAGILGFFLLVSFPIWLYYRERRKVERAISKQGPLFFSFSDEGLTMQDQNGVSTSVPWSVYSSFREGKKIFALQQIEPRGFRAIPKDPETSEKVRSFLLAKMPEIK